MQESRLEWYGHVLRREEECVVNTAMGCRRIEGEEDSGGRGGINREQLGEKIVNLLWRKHHIKHASPKPSSH